MTDEENALIEAARRARHSAHAPYSGFQVGAALEAGGDIFIGCNVENASYGLTICAERAAVLHAIASGRREFKRMVIISPGGLAPCGACRQVLAEFCDDLDILLVDVERSDAVRRCQLNRLLPDRFMLSSK